MSRAVSSFGLFLRDTKNSFLLKGLGFQERSKKVTKMFHALTPAERATLERRAKKVSYTRRPKKADRRRLPNKSLYTQFVRKQFGKVTGLPRARMTKIGKLWSKIQSAKAAADKAAVAKVVAAAKAKSKRSFKKSRKTQKK
ncbi:kinetoplast DNA-associated protein, putative [Bodo saltans]|uniref:Kinetoplast DNA-associated protein, putative n=1 Tax=Bodo saltans TaxID=75058 RepID=A0A0S4J5T0_BODSA|nr:kinetoplast DNA-associated protein, putative [Bodo saltans]|eukprot:CUG85598.1 kinetoplast DNA-associated protein, putative [Bodo saltans]